MEGLHMNYTSYEIKGKHAETKRTRTLKIKAVNEEDAKCQALESNLESIESIAVIPFDAPTQRQIDYAKSLGIHIRSEYTSQDVSALISKHVDNDDEHTDGLFHFATNHRVHVSKYIGETALHGAIFHNLPTVDRIAFFVFAVYRDIKGDNYSNLDIHPHRAKFYEFAESMKSDDKFIKSLEQYNGGKEIRYFGTKKIKNGLEESTLSGGSTRTTAYKSARQFLIEQNLISANATSSKTIGKSSKFNTPSFEIPSPDNKQQAKGCGSATIVFLVILAGLLGSMSFVI